MSKIEVKKVELKEGVYLKPNGGLVELKKSGWSNGDNKSYKYLWEIFNGKKTKNKLIIAFFGHPYISIFYKVYGEYFNPVGKSKFLNKCEYLGKL